MTVGLDSEEYNWEIGLLKNNSAPIPVSYLIGIPI